VNGVDLKYFNIFWHGHKMLFAGRIKVRPRSLFAATADKKLCGAFVYGWNAKIEHNVLKQGVLSILPDFLGRKKLRLFGSPVLMFEKNKRERRRK
jgi:hypothetical protein